MALKEFLYLPLALFVLGTFSIFFAQFIMVKPFFSEIQWIGGIIYGVILLNSGQIIYELRKLQRVREKKQ